MDFKNHAKYGLVGAMASPFIYSGVSVYIIKTPVHVENVIAVFMACFIGSLSPDFDTNSIPSRYASLLLSLFGAYSIYAKEPYLALVLSSGFLFIKASRHRGWTHTYSLALLMFVFSYNIHYLFIPFGLGLLIHYYCDSMEILKKSNWLKSYIL